MTPPSSDPAGGYCASAKLADRWRAIVERDIARSCAAVHAMGTVDRSLVAHLPLFAGLDSDQLAEILREARSARHARNSEIFAQGADAQSFFLLLHGHVRASKTTPAGDQIVVRYVVPGETFGLAVAIGLTRYPATATAVDDSVMLAWPTPAWPRLVERFPSLATSTLQTVGGRLQEVQIRVIEMSTQQVERRIAHALLRLAKQSGRKVDHGIEIDFPISRQDIAQLTGTTLHTVSRTFERLGTKRADRKRPATHRATRTAQDLPACRARRQ